VRRANDNDPSDLSDLVFDVDEHAKTLRYIPAVFLGERVPPHRADEKLPERRKPRSVDDTLTGRRTA
jgi:hypothetical protein